MQSQFVGVEDIPSLHGIIVWDNCGPHCADSIRKLCIENNIRIIGLVPHSSHLTQMLDLGIFGRMKRKIIQHKASRGLIHSKFGGSENMFQKLSIEECEKVPNEWIDNDLLKGMSPEEIEEEKVFLRDSCLECLSKSQLKASIKQREREYNGIG